MLGYFTILAERVAFNEIQQKKKNIKKWNYETTNTKKLKDKNRFLQYCYIQGKNKDNILGVSTIQATTTLNETSILITLGSDEICEPHNV